MLTCFCRRQYVNTEVLSISKLAATDGLSETLSSGRAMYHVQAHAYSDKTQCHWTTV